LSLRIGPHLTGRTIASQTTAAEVKEKLTNAAEANDRISLAREEYRPVATRGALIYFLITDLVTINKMYQVSLQQASPRV